MQQLEEQLKRTNEKLGQLIRQYQLLQKENGKLKLDIKQVNENQESINLQKEKLQQQVEILKLSKGEMTEAEKKTFEKRLSDYVKEIDRCIALLND